MRRRPRRRDNAPIGTPTIATRTTTRLRSTRTTSRFPPRKSILPFAPRPLTWSTHTMTRDAISSAAIRTTRLPAASRPLRAFAAIVMSRRILFRKLQSLHLRLLKMLRESSPKTCLSLILTPPLQWGTSLRMSYSCPMSTRMVVKRLSRFTH